MPRMLEAIAHGMYPSEADQAPVATTAMTNAMRAHAWDMPKTAATGRRRDMVPPMKSPPPHNREDSNAASEAIAAGYRSPAAACLTARGHSGT